MLLAKRPSAVFRVLLIGVACLTVVAGILTWAFFGLHQYNSDFGTIGIVDYTTSETASPCSRVLLSVLENSPLAMAGVRAGDRYCFDREVQRGMDLLANEHVGMQAIHANQIRHLDLTAIAYPLKPRRVVYALLNPFVSIVTTLIGLLIGLRAGKRSDLRSLGFGLVLIGMVEPTSMPYWAAVPITFAYLLSALGPIYILLFVLEFPGQDVGPWRRRLGGVRRVALIAAVGILGVFWANRFTHWSGGLINAIEGYYALVMSLLIGVAVVVGWIEASGKMRARFNWLLPAILSLGVGCFFTLVPALPSQYDGWVTFGVYVLALVFPVGLAYATLKHRVLDFGFAVNRALVYTITSSLLLIAFSLTEFAVDKLLHFHGRQASIVIDALVALGVILTFHRIQHWVGHRIDHVFYHDWQEAAERFGKFLESSTQITQAAVLTERFVAAIDQFIRPGATAIYLRSPDGSYRLAESTLPNAPADIDVDDESVIQMRHRLEVVTIVDGAAFGIASLAVPMSVHGLLDGFLLLADKQNGASFRSDELKALSAAALRLAGNLEFLRVTKLDKENNALKEQIRHLQQAELIAKNAVQAAEHERTIAALRTGQ